MRSIAFRAASTATSVYYFVSGVLVSLSVSALFSAIGVVPAPANFMWLLICCGLTGLASYFLWSMAGSLDAMAEIAGARARQSDSGLQQLRGDIADEYGRIIVVRLGISLVAAILGLVALVIGQLVETA